MEKPKFDPGLTQQYTGALNRTINRDGQFNVYRKGATWRDFHPYLFLINASWPVFFFAVLLAFLFVNCIFAGMYLLVGIGHLKGTDSSAVSSPFLNAFFFSAHTLTTVGYGNIWPSGTLANTLASFESLAGLLAFALATGLLFGRFSRPSARFGFSTEMIVAPYQDGISLQFRVVNRRSNNLINVRARVLLMSVDFNQTPPRREFKQLDLEREEIGFLALTWTVVHAIDDNSPLRGKTAQDLAQLQAEFLVSMQGYDDTFAQMVHARYSYRHDEIKWGARFLPAFEIDKDGRLRLEIDRISNSEAVDLRPPP